MSPSRLSRVLFVLAALALPAAAAADSGASDPNAPAIEIASPMDGGAYPQGYHLQAGYGCWSPVNELISCEGSAPLGAYLDTTIAGTRTFSVTATDFEGRTTTATATYTIIDITPPTAVVRAPADGAAYELGSNVTVDFDCVDESGPVQFCAASLPAGWPLDTSHAGTFSFYVDVVDAAGNYARTWTKYSVVDSSPPSIVIRAPVDGATYTLGSDVRADYACFDTPPGFVVSCDGNVTSGSSLDTSTVGTKRFTVAAKDAGRNLSTASSAYRVVYDFAGFFAPVTSPFTEAKAGETVPMKFSLGGDRGDDIGRAGWRPCGALDVAAATGRLAYQPQPQRYTYYWSTDASWTGTCREFVLTLRDGTVHTARFQFTR
jgi:hypothetical protein